jgi:hypothetical protein
MHKAIEQKREFLIPEDHASDGSATAGSSVHVRFRSAGFMRMKRNS